MVGIFPKDWIILVLRRRRRISNMSTEFSDIKVIQNVKTLGAHVAGVGAHLPNRGLAEAAFVCRGKVPFTSSSKTVPLFVIFPWGQKLSHVGEIDAGLPIHGEAHGG